MAEERWHDFAKEKPSEDMEGRNFIVSNGHYEKIATWCGYWENEPFMGDRLCDEVVRWKFYFTPEEEKANEAIAELKAENERLKKQSSCTFSDDSLRVRQLKRKIADNSEKILELQKALDVALSEVYSLLDKIESLKALHYAEMVDAGMENNILKRALWLTRALRARDIQRWWLQVTCSPRTEIACRKWNNVERKCRAKAEEYR